MKKFHILSFLFLTGCLFDGSGWGNNPTITDSGTNETSTNSTTILLGDVTTSTSGIETTGTTEVIESSTGIETTESIGSTTSSTSTGFDSNSSEDSSSSGSSGSSESSGSSGGVPESCGNCLLERNEECDSCSYNKLESYCASSDDPNYEKCTIGFNNLLGFITAFGALNGMQTAKYDQEEADLLCKIFLHSVSVKATDFNINMGYSPAYSFISPIDIQGKGTLLKSATKYYAGGSLYFFEYNDIPFNQNLDSIFYVFGCQVI